jgi:rhodanese-related sulfurtransferase
VPIGIAAALSSVARSVRAFYRIHGHTFGAFGSRTHRGSARAAPTPVIDRVSGDYGIMAPFQPPMTQDPKVDAILQAAQKRARELGLPYAGAVFPAEAHALMQAGARLVDIRTQAELYWVGRIPGAVMVEWNSYPGGALNLDFINQLAEYVAPEETTLFICRSGGRSHHAAIAATQAGFGHSYNVLEGFEGDKDPQGHRSTLGGWRVAGLPWLQS